MAKPGYKVCWWFSSPASKRSPTCRTLSVKQHRNAREAAETVIMQNPSAVVQVTLPQGGRQVFKRTRRGIRRIDDLWS